MRLTVVGDVLLDRDLDGPVERLAPDAPVPVVADPKELARPGGAGLAALLASADGHDVTLVTALAADDGARELAGLLAAAGVTVVDLGLRGATPEKVRIRAGGLPVVRLDRGGDGGAVGPLTDDARRALAGAAAVLVSDYGRGVAAEATVRRALEQLPRRVPVVWDPHPRGPAPVRGVRVATPNRAEAGRFCDPDPAGGQQAPVAEDGLGSAARAARALRDRWQARAVAVTLGSRGALLVDGDGDGAPLVVPAPEVATGDPCGAGDRFASRLAGLLGQGALLSEAVAGAVGAASAFVAEGGAAAVRLDGRVIDLTTADPAGATPPHPASTAPHPVLAPASRLADAPDLGPKRAVGGRSDAVRLAERVRAQGGTVVAAGGCFDLLHAGHVSLLQAARRLGDCLVVCVNSDVSVRRLKGPDRPVVGEDDRAALLLALGCVDAVVLFDEDTPVEALRRLRPHVWAKGGDYAGAVLPESTVLAEWGGQAVVLPYLDGRSTTRILQEVNHHVPPAR